MGPDSKGGLASRRHQLPKSVAIGLASSTSSNPNQREFTMVTCVADYPLGDEILSHLQLGAPLA